MGLSGGGTQKSTTEPWKAQQPYIKEGFAKAKDLLNSGGPQYFPGQTVAPMSGMTENAIGNLYGMGGGSSTLNAGSGLMDQTLRGDFLNPNSNPYLQSYYQRGLESVMPSIDSAFGQSGRTGSGSHAMAVGRGTADLATGIYGGAYDAERGRQMQTLGMVPGMESARLQDMTAALGAGQTLDQYKQSLIDAEKARWDFNQQRPENALDAYMNRIGGSYGGTTSTKTNSNIFGQVLGSLMMGTDIYKKFFPTPGGAKP